MRAAQAAYDGDMWVWQTHGNILMLDPDDRMVYVPDVFESSWGTEHDVASVGKYRGQMPAGYKSGIIHQDKIEWEARPPCGWGEP